MKEACGTCRFGRALFSEEPDSDPTAPLFCHRRSPVAAQANADADDDDGDTYEAQWPRVFAHDWCGEWESCDAAA